MSACERPLKERLRENYEYLVKELRVSNYVDALFGAKVISDQDKQKIRDLRDKYEQARYFLDGLMCKSEKTIANFFEVVKTGDDEQPHIYEKVFTRSEEQNTQDDRRSDAATRSPTATKLSTEVDSEWEELLVPRLPAVVAALRPSLLLDHFRATGLINAEEYGRLQQGILTEKRRSQDLLHDILPCRTRGSFATFCKVLLVVDGQQHIVSDILKVRPIATSPADRAVIVSPHCSHTSGAESSAVSAVATADRFMQEQPTTFREVRGAATSSESLVSGNTVSQEQSRDLIASQPECNLGSCLQAVERKKERAMFLIEPRHQKLFKHIERVLKSATANCFGIEQTKVTLLYAEISDVKMMLKSWTHSCYLDLESKLGVLIFDGIEKEIVDSHCDELEQLIEMHVQKVNPSHALPHGCRVLEIITSSSFVVLRLSSDFYICLLLAIGSQELRAELSNSLKDLFPKARRAVFRLGGFPPLELFTEVTDSLSIECEGNSTVLEQGSVPSFSLHQCCAYLNCAVDGIAGMRTSLPIETIYTDSTFDNGKCYT